MNWLANPDHAPLTWSDRLFTLRASLQEGGFCSGQRLALQLRVSRTSVWKSLSALRALGYEIEAAPRRGYRLVSIPDVPFPWEIGLHLSRLVEACAKGSGSRRFYYYPVVGSTNDAARELAERGAPAGTLVVADRQTRGRGRRGRVWQSPSGGIYLSLVERPRLHPRHAPLAAAAAALAVAEVVHESCGADTRIKWPNDVLVDGRKLSGVLAELAADQETVRYVIIGIGVNVTPLAPPGPAGLMPVSLVELGCHRPRAEIVARIVAKVEAFLQEFQADPVAASEKLAAAVEARLAWKGQEVRVETPAGVVEGVLEGIHGTGALLVRGFDGKLHHIFAGDASLRAGGTSALTAPASAQAPGFREPDPRA